MIERRTLPSGHLSWRVRWYGPDRKERSKSFRTQRDAKRFEAERLASRDGWISPQRGTVRLVSVWEKFNESQSHLKPSTLNGYQSAWHAHISPAFGEWQVGKIRFAEISEWVGAMSKARKPATTRKAFRVLSRILGWAVDAGLVGRNEATGVKLPRQARHDVQVATASQVMALSAVVNPRAEDLVLFLAFTGVRWGEAAALQVGDVDLEKRRIRVRRATVAVSGKLNLGSPKSHQHRDVPIVDVLAPILKRRMRGRDPSQLVFPTNRETPWSNDNFRRDSNWRKATAAVGLEGFRIHDLRHTAASLMIQSGATVVDVSAVLGHASSHTTLTIYAHLIGSRLDDVNNLMNAALTQPYGQNTATEATASTS
ncbi:MAG: tyrosine-type recombinase/integrase [Solirubrobacterales bacterium]